MNKIRKVWPKAMVNAVEYAFNTNGYIGWYVNAKRVKFNKTIKRRIIKQMFKNDWVKIPTNLSEISSVYIGWL